MSETIDEVVSMRAGTGPVARATVEENVTEGGVVSERNASGVVNEDVSDGARRARRLNESTKKLLDIADGKADPPAEGGEVEASDPDDAGLEEAETKTEAAAEGEKTEEEKAPPVDEWREKYTKLEEHNRRLASELDTERKKPRVTPSKRDQALSEAEQAYVDEGPVVAMRKFLSVVLDVPPDSPDVDAELSGLYTDLTARELNVPLEQSHKAIREAARARLALARDKRERKAQSEATKPEPTDGSEGVEQAAKLIGSRMTAQREGSKSFADEHPLLMTFARDLDGFPPEVLVAKVIQREIQVGTLDPSLGDDELIRRAAKIVESHYTAIADRFSKAKPSQTPDTTKSSEQVATPKKTESNEQRQGTGARTITSAAASVAPATSPTKKQTTSGEKTRKDFKSDKEWRDHLLTKHFR